MVSIETNQPRYLQDGLDDEVALQGMQAEAMRQLIQNLQAIIAEFRKELEALSTLGIHMPAAAAAEQRNKIDVLWQLTEDLELLAHNQDAALQAHEDLIIALRNVRQVYSVLSGVSEPATLTADN